MSCNLIAKKRQIEDYKLNYYPWRNSKSFIHLIWKEPTEMNSTITTAAQQQGLRIVVKASLGHAKSVINYEIGSFV